MLNSLPLQSIRRFRVSHFNLLDHLTAVENVALPNVFAPAKNRITNPIERGCGTR